MKQILEELELKANVRENVINLIWQWYARQHQIKTKQNFGRENDSESNDEFKDQHSSTLTLSASYHFFYNNRKLRNIYFYHMKWFFNLYIKSRYSGFQLTP